MRLPKAEQLQPAPDLANPFLITRGNPSLRAQLTHSAGFDYITNLNPLSYTFWQIRGNVQVIENKITSSITTLPGGIMAQQYINANGAYSLDGSATFGFPLIRKQYGSGKVMASASYGKDISYLDGKPNTLGFFAAFEKLSLNLNLGDKWTASCEGAVSYKTSDYSTGSQTALFIQYYTANISYTLPGGMRLDTDCSWLLTGRQGGLPSSQTTSWNAHLAKTIFHNKAGELRLSGMDLLNNATGVSQTTGANFIELSQAQVLGRYFKISFFYKTVYK